MQLSPVFRLHVLLLLFFSLRPNSWLLAARGTMIHYWYLFLFLFYYYFYFVFFIFLFFLFFYLFLRTIECEVLSVQRVFTQHLPLLNSINTPHPTQHLTHTSAHAVTRPMSWINTLLIPPPPLVKTPQAG
jgi:hypothetical protein